MPRKKKPTPNEVVLEKLTQWSTDNDVSDDPYIEGVSYALQKKKNLDAWATLDPLEYLPHPEGIAGTRRLSNARYISIIRNILVFTPVAITWEAVSKATTAFSEFVQSNNAATVNFLEFWQNGYDVLDHRWTISNIAQIDFIIVTIVIFLSVVASTMNERGRFLRLQERERIESERIALAVSLKMFLYTKRQVSNVSLNEDLARSIQNLSNATESIENATIKLEKSLKDFPHDALFKKELKDFIKVINSSLKNKSSS